MKKLFILISSLLVSLLFISCNSNQNTAISPELSTTTENTNIEIPSTQEIIQYLCSKNIEDRSEGTKGNLLVTNYLNDIFEQLNLDYVFNNSYLNEFNYANINNETTYASNVVGKISGSDSTTAIIITAHFDAWFNGAIDNASGVASLIDIAKNLKIYSESNNLNYDIIFCLTNLEMSQFKGSKAFIKSINNKYTNLFNVNIDCIGVNNNQPMAIKNLSNILSSQKLYDDLKESYDLYNIKYIDDFSTPKTKLAFEQNQGVSDYISFEKNNIPNMQIAQKGINDYILTENDTPDKLDINLIDNISKAISHFLKNFKL